MANEVAADPWPAAVASPDVDTDASTNGSGGARGRAGSEKGGGEESTREKICGEKGYSEAPKP